MPHSRTLRWRLAALVMVALIALVTLTPADQSRTNTPWYCILCDDQALTDAVLNIVMFVPMGLSLRLAGASAARAFLACAGLSVLIEALQFSVVAGRDPSLRDVLTNSLGALVGIAIALRWHALLTPTRRTARGLAALSASLFLLVVGASGAALTPCAPAEPYDGAWAPHVPGEDPFGGHILDATLNGAPWPNGVVIAARDLRARLEEGHVSASALVVPDKNQSISSTMLTLSGFQRVAVGISQAGRSVVVTLPQCAVPLRLRAPLYSLPAGLEGATPRSTSPQPVTISLSAQRHLLELSAGPSADHVRRVSLRITPFLGWAILRPFYATIHTSTPALTLLWLAAWLAPLGYWTAWAAHPDPARRSESRLALTTLTLAVGLAVVTAGLTGIPRMLALSAANGPEWSVSLASFAMAAAIGWIRARRWSRPRAGSEDWQVREQAGEQGRNLEHRPPRFTET